ncbi:lipopolysaccharide export system permease protein [Rhodobacter aestuarii]|uniref:Lipopolysaccharide export system permease protein n=1 Tax=Rhodobacter aestuarii TaxID=453582 RepID=A0A1N7M6H0_9RHOB|nr:MULTISPECIES: LPS export ABC transporter permease LptG [Rhodobacter]PTV94879.1 lipopolysaccharide export system permease protein [Rhodobacter aestuarii]SIS81677.1 lipopolysaccharide export system permease protein [Rhodobacter aestuarii]SOC14000.1 lipopolysaccharide export system permease protein [Rhodobacter sp. JA431]
MTLSLYIAQRFLRALGIVAGAFAGVLFLIEIVEKIRSISAEQGGLADAATLAALSLPKTLYSIFPLITVLAAVVLFLGLARSSELVVIRAAGRSALRMLMAPVMVALLLGVVLVMVGNPIVSATTQRAEEIEGQMRAEGTQTISVSREGIWMRQGTADGGQAVIHALRGNTDATALYDVTFLVFDAERGPIRRLDAASAQLGPGAWDLRDAKDWPLGTSTNPERDATHHDQLLLPSTLTAKSIADSFDAPSAVPIWELPSFISALEEAGFSARRHLVWLQAELSQPLMMAAMVLLAAGFTMRHARFGGTGGRVLMALLAGLSVFFLRNMAQVLGDNGQIPPALAGWAPPAIAAMLALAWLLQQEEG